MVFPIFGDCSTAVEQPGIEDSVFWTGIQGKLQYIVANTYIQSPKKIIIYD